MAIKVATLAVDVTVAGVAKAVAGLRTTEQAVTRLQKSLKGTTEGVIKTWAAYNLLTSQSAIAASYTQQFGAVFGSLIDSILLPITPILDLVVDAFWRFSDWFAQQGPFVHAVMLALGLAGALMWLGVSGPLAIAIAGFVAFGYWWVQQGPVIQGILAVLAVAFGIFWAVATGGIAPLIAGITLLVGWLLKVTGLLDPILNFFGLGGGGGPTIPEAPQIPTQPAPSGIAQTPAGAGGGTSVTNNYAIDLSTYGGDAGGRDAALALQSQLALSQRTT